MLLCVVLVALSALSLYVSFLHVFPVQSTIHAVHDRHTLLSPVASARPAVWYGQ